MIRRLLLPLFWFIELPLALLAALVLSFWLWSGSEQSLAGALNLAGRYLPSGHRLVAEEVTGSLRRGGSIASLRWEWNGLTLQARGVEFTWRPSELLLGRLQFDMMQVAQLSIDDRSPPSDETALDELVLPLQLELPFSVGLLSWVGPPSVEATAITGRYRFDGQDHQLTLDQARVAAGQYQAKATLLARAPMSLAVQLQGNVLAPLGQRQIPLDASASLSGSLAGPDVVLDLTARLQSRGAPRAPDASAGNTAMGANMSAKLRPWAKQPILKAESAFTLLNLATLWPGAPQSLLSGSAQVDPKGANWLARLALTNRLPGPLDQGRLPVDSAKATVEYADGRWNIQALSAEGAGGQVNAEGRLGNAALLGALSGWQVQARLEGLDPALVQSQLAPIRLNGEIRASAAKQAVEFEASIQPSAKQGKASPLQGLRVQNLAAKGQWADGRLSLQNIRLQTSDALLEGVLEVQPAAKSARGKLLLSVPGAQGQANGQLAPSDGAGELSLQISDASKLTQWLARLPRLAQVVSGFELRGRADFALRWQGGWQQTPGPRGVEPTLQASIVAPQLDLRTGQQTGAQVLQLRDFAAELSGRLSAMALKLGGELRAGPRLMVVQAQAQGGRAADGSWQLAVSPLKLQAQNDRRPGKWTLALRKSLVLDWQATASGASLRASPGEAELTGPLPGVATLAWQPVRWRYGGQNEFSSRGEVRGVDMAWLDLLGNTQLASLGLSGDMVFDADWELEAGDSFKLRAGLVRRAGDIRVLADNLGGAGSSAGGVVIDAGVRDARVTIRGDGDTVSAAIRWDSEHAGNARGEFSTTLIHGVDGWSWAADAPVSATLRARLPQVGVWSVLAPPGWRLRGTLDANMALSGSRQAPQWSGTLQADDLALRSVADGIEFGGGRLRAAIVGQRLFINEFSLQGAGGAAGGELNAKGSAIWLADDSGASPALAKVRIELDATARALRVSARADRRLAVSGTVQIRLLDSRLDIQGNLKADQALFILPEENAPSLGSDVVIKPSAPAGASGTVAAAGATDGDNGATVAARISTELSVTLDLGPDFRVRGRGIDTRLAGTLQLRALTGSSNEAPRLTGEVNTVRGSYKAYGQQLDIEQGTMRFNGPYDNPALDILAIRPNLTQRVGVQITGTALAPRVRLYAEPEMPDADKLAWLVLGRSGANGGAQAAVLQQAALALLGGNSGGVSGGLSNALGLDQVSIAGGVSNSDGTTSVATVTLGKRISRDFYVAYQRSLSGTLGTISIFYDLSKQFTLRASTGEQNAIDVIYTIRYD